MMTGQHALADETGALVNFGALMVGLYHKKMTGEGQKIETSLLGSMVRLMGFSMTQVLFTNKELPRRGRARVSGGVAPNFTGSFVDKDGRGFIFQIVGEEAWQKGMAAAGFSERLAEAGFDKLGDIADSDEKTQHFLATMDKFFATDTRERWIKVLRGYDIICAPINTVLETSRDLDVIANKYIIEVDHPRVGKIKEVGFPWEFSRFSPKAGVAPELGGHNHEILQELGYSDADIMQLRTEEVI
jgi:crotonobetainyl-CoA:carnitine CoA-transferase CaiB-like acyl-CoA transferase